MPTSPLKRPSGGGGGRLGRLLASLRPPARAGPLPVQTGFPTSLADIVVKNHGRLRIPRRRHRAARAPTAAAEPAPISQSQQRRELSVAHDAAAPVLVPARPGKGADLSIRPGLLAAGGAVALVLLVIWSKKLVAAATLASVVLSWIESVRTVRDRRSETDQEVDPRRLRLSCAEYESDSGGSQTASLCSRGDDDDSWMNNNNAKPKQSRRSLRKLLANKLRNRKTAQGTDSGEHPGAGEANAEPAPTEAAGALAEEKPEATTDDDRWHRRRGRALPLPALVPIILAGLVAGKLPALALAVLCAAFSSSVEERVPVPSSGDHGHWW